MIRHFKQVSASKIGVEPTYIKGFESHGLLYFSNEYHPVESYGAQCGNCHIIVWITGRDDPILFEPVPVEYSQDGEKYRKYRKNKLKRFLASLPPCPNCSIQNYDLFVNNVTQTRYEDGTQFKSGRDGAVNDELSKLEQDRSIWWYGDEDEAKRLGL